MLVHKQQNVASEDTISVCPSIFQFIRPTFRVAKLKLCPSVRTGQNIFHFFPSHCGSCFCLLCLRRFHFEVLCELGLRRCHLCAVLSLCDFFCRSLRARIVII